jgi:hypothetical protein
MTASNNLILVRETNRKIGYDFKKELSYTDLESYHNLVMAGETSQYLAVVGAYNSKIIPMIDCDSLEDYKLAFGHLSRYEIRCSLIQSSPNHYWLFPDFSFSSVEAALSTIKVIPGCDDKYVKFTKNRSFFAIRGELKAIDETPKLIYNECTEVNVVSFVSELYAHFKDARVLRIANKKFKKSGGYIPDKRKEPTWAVY